MKKIIGIMAIGIVGMVISCNGKKNIPDASGVFEATEVVISSEGTGKILSFSVDEGEELKAGDLVGIIDTVQLSLKRLQLIAQLKSVQSRRPDFNAQIATLDQQIATAKTEKTRIENLITANVANKKQFDDIVAQIAVLEKQRAALKSTLSSTTVGVNSESSAMEIQIAQIDDQLAKCRIVNPIAGTVLGKYAEEYEITSAGKALYKIANTKEMILRAYITSAQLTTLKIGDSVAVRADFGKKENRKYSGTVEWISSKAEFTPKTIQTRDERANLVYAVKVSVQNDGYLKIGMYGDVTFSKSKAQ